jgi:hypothetical protein
MRIISLLPGLLLSLLVSGLAIRTEQGGGWIGWSLYRAGVHNESAAAPASDPAPLNYSGPYQDIVHSLNVLRRPNSECLVLIEDDGYTKNVMCRWSPKN